MRADLIVGIGWALISLGVTVIYPPAGLIVLGLGLTVAGVIMAYKEGIYGADK